MNIYSIPPILTLCSLLGLGVLTVRHGRWTGADILFFVICLLGSFLYIDILLVFNVQSAKTALLISRVDHIFIVYLFPVYLHFFHVYIGIKKRNWLILFAYVYAFILMWFTQSPLYIESMEKYYFGFFAKGGVIYPFFGVLTLFVSVYVVLLIYHAIRLEKSSIRKFKLKYMLAGFGIMGLLNGLNILPISGISIYPPGNLSFLPLIIFGFGLFKHDLLDTGVLIQKGLIYSILTSFLTGLYALVIIGANSLLSGYDFSNSIFFSIAFFFLIAVILGPLKTQIQVIVDRIFLKGKYNYQKTVKKVGRMITSVLDVAGISKQIMDTVTETMQIDNCSLFLCNSAEDEFENYSVSERTASSIPTTFGKDSSIVQALKELQKPIFCSHFMEQQDRACLENIISEFDMLNAVIVIPMIYKDGLNGFLSLGEKRSGDLFTSEDIDLLETLASQGSLAVENAKAYRQIAELNENLEKTVEERTVALKEALHEKERTQEQLIRSESLAAIGQLVAGTAHELNNPLASVTSLLQSSIEDLRGWDGKDSLDDDFIEDLEFAEKELKRAKNIVDSLLGLSRQRQTYSENVNMNAVVKDALRILYNQYKNGNLDIIEHYAQNLPEVQGNFSNLGQVSLNIIQNAIQALGEAGGKIFISTRYEKGIKQVVFECADTGPGIPNAHRQDIFKPFFTTKTVGKGTGLGLYICHEIVEKHGGTIKLQDNNGQGAKFVVSLPAKTA